MAPARLSRTLHKWLALVVRLQAIVWVATGFYMVVVDLDFIHGDTLVRNLAMPLPRAAAAMPLDEIRAHTADIEQIRIKALPGFDSPLYEFRTSSGIVLVEGASGERISPLPKSRVKSLARYYYAGSGALANVELLAGKPPLEIQTRALPLWRADFDDWLKTSLYIHPDSGVLVTRRHRLWRWFDALWMLHIMDYEARTDVNNALLRIATVAGIVFIASGGWLLFFSFRRRRSRVAG